MTGLCCQLTIGEILSPVPLGSLQDDKKKGRLLRKMMTADHSVLNRGKGKTTLDVDHDSDNERVVDAVRPRNPEGVF